MDIQHCYSESGTGDVLILLHGNGENSEYFTYQIDAFSEHYRVIALDTRGHGKTQRGTAPFTLEQLADDLYGFMTEHSIRKAHILGFSDGGNIALLFALKHPYMVDKLILNGADLNTNGVKASIQIPIEFGYRIVSLISHFDKKAVAKKEMLGLMVGQPDIKPEALHELRIPSLVIVRTDDMIKDKHSRLIADSIPGCRFVAISGDHFIAVKNSEPFNREVLKFLSEDSL